MINRAILTGALLLSLGACVKDIAPLKPAPQQSQAQLDIQEMRLQGRVTSLILHKDGTFRQDLQSTAGGTRHLKSFAGTWNKLETGEICLHKTVETDITGPATAVHEPRDFTECYQLDKTTKTGKVGYRVTYSSGNTNRSEFTVSPVDHAKLYMFESDVRAASFTQIAPLDFLDRANRTPFVIDQEARLGQFFRQISAVGTLASNGTELFLAGKSGSLSGMTTILPVSVQDNLMCVPWKDEERCVSIYQSRQTGRVYMFSQTSHLSLFGGTFGERP